MIQAKCIQKFRNKQNQIYGYRIQDTQGNLKDVTTQQLKQAIQNKQINVINLTLTLDNRLVDTTQKQQAPKNKTIAPQQFSLFKPQIEDTPMIKAKCIQKFHDKNNHIYGYRLQDTQGAIKDVLADQLKIAIKNKQINIINLTLTSDNRLIDTNTNTNSNNSDNSNNDFWWLFNDSAKVNDKESLAKYFCSIADKILSMNKNEQLTYAKWCEEKLNILSRNKSFQEQFAIFWDTPSKMLDAGKTKNYQGPVFESIEMHYDIGGLAILAGKYIFDMLSNNDISAINIYKIHKNSKVFNSDVIYNVAVGGALSSLTPLDYIVQSGLNINKNELYRRTFMRME